MHRDNSNLPPMGTDNLASLRPARPHVEPEADIPVLDEIIAPQSAHRGRSAEASADDQLSLTNRYKTLTERDLERAAAANDAAAGQGTQSSASEPAIVNLDHCLIDDDFDFSFDDDTGFDESLQQLAMELYGDRVSAKIKTILPDLDKLNAELGVEPLATPPSRPNPMEKTVTVAKLSTGQAAPAAKNAPPAMANFSLSSSTLINVPTGVLYQQPATEPTGLSLVQLKNLLEQALNDQIPAFKESLLRQLAPLVCHDSEPEA